MADTFTTNLDLTKPEIGASSDTWGDKLNDNFDAIDQVFAANGSGTSVGLNIGTGKTLAVTGTANLGGVTNVTGALRFSGASGGVSSAGNAWLPFLNTAAAGAQAKWRWGTGVGNTAFFGLQRNTAAGGDFATVENSLYIDTTDSMTLKGNFTAGGNVKAGGNLEGNGAIVTGNVVAGGTVQGSNVVQTSDARLKKDVQPVLDALEKVRKINGVTYVRIAMPEAPRELGLIAQNVQEVVPEVVGGSPGGYLTVAYANLVALLIEAVKEMAERLETLEDAVLPQEITP